MSFIILIQIGIFLLFTNKTIYSNSNLILNIFNQNKFTNEPFNNSLIQTFEELIQRKKYDINCELILNKNSFELSRSKKILSNLKVNSSKKRVDLLPDENFIFNKVKCSEFKKIRQYGRFNDLINETELNFPLAFSILVYEHVEQFERLLNTIYRPHNIYCIHIDLKSSPEFKKAVKSIVDCFDNVFITTKLEYVIYAGFSRLKADLNCIDDLLNFNSKRFSGNYISFKNKKYVNWKYFVNLANTEFPIKSNLKMVEIIKNLNGSNSIAIDKKFSTLTRRYQYLWFNDVIKNSIYPIKRLYKNNPPHNIIVMKGSAYGVFERQFLHNIFKNPKIKDFIEWSKSTYSPDEIFWATLEYNTHLYPNSKYINDPSKNSVYGLSRFLRWHSNYKCGGYWRHALCVFSLDDLNFVTNQTRLIANKFYLNYDPLSYQCMQEWYDNMVIQENMNSTLNK